MVHVDAATKHRIAVEEHGVTVERLNETVKQRDVEIRAMREADVQRTAVLQSAVQTYVARSPYTA